MRRLPQGIHRGGTVNRVFSQYREKSIDDFQGYTAALEDVVKRTNFYIQEIPYNRTHGVGLLLVGQSGVGKTFLANMVLKSAQEKHGYKIEAVELSTYIDLHHKTFKLSNDDDRFDRAFDHLEYIKRADFVLFDDIGR